MNKLLRVILLCLLLGFGVQSAFADDLSIQKSADALKSQLQSELSICSNERGFELLKPATEKLNLLDYSQQGDSNFESVDKDKIHLKGQRAFDERLDTWVFKASFAIGQFNLFGKIENEKCREAILRNVEDLLDSHPRFNQPNDQTKILSIPDLVALTEYKRANLYMQYASAITDTVNEDNYWWRPATAPAHPSLHKPTDNDLLQEKYIVKVNSEFEKMRAYKTQQTCAVDFMKYDGYKNMLMNKERTEYSMHTVAVNAINSGEEVIECMGGDVNPYFESQVYSMYPMMFLLKNFNSSDDIKMRENLIPKLQKWVKTNGESYDCKTRAVQERGLSIQPNDDEKITQSCHDIYALPLQIGLIESGLSERMKWNIEAYVKNILSDEKADMFVFAQKNCQGLLDLKPSVFAQASRYQEFHSTVEFLCQKGQ